MFKVVSKTIQFTVALTFIVIVLGAYTRLKDAGLGCPDWPGCYGHLLAPNVSANFTLTEATKAWIEMIHRYIAGTLGLLIAFLAWQSIRLRKQASGLWIWTTILVALVIFQAVLGMWTVTMRLNPLVVMSHLMGGIAIISILWWLYLKCSNLPHVQTTYSTRMLSSLSVIILLMQIALGGWTSANYAALVCADFPTCQGQWWPTLDWQNAFAIPGIPLENSARVTIQMAHRIGALFTTLICSALVIQCWRNKNKKVQLLATILASLLSIQIVLGISNVLAGMPLYVSLAHSAFAVLLLLCLLTMRYMTYDRN